MPIEKLMQKVMSFAYYFSSLSTLNFLMNINKIFCKNAKKQETKKNLKKRAKNLKIIFKYSEYIHIFTKDIY